MNVCHLEASAFADDEGLQACKRFEIVPRAFSIVWPVVFGFVVAEASEEDSGGWPGLGIVGVPWSGRDGYVAHYAQIDREVLLARCWGVRGVVPGPFPECAHQSMDILDVHACVGRLQRLVRSQRCNCIWEPNRSRGGRPAGECLEVEQVVLGVEPASERRVGTWYVLKEVYHG